MSSRLKLQEVVQAPGGRFQLFWESFKPGEAVSNRLEGRSNPVMWLSKAPAWPQGIRNEAFTSKLPKQRGFHAFSLAGAAARSGRLRILANPEKRF